MASLGELFVELGVFGDVEDLKKAEKRIQDFIKTNDKAKKGQDDFSKSIKDGMKAFAGVVAAVTGAVYALNRLTTSLMDSNNAMLDLTRQSDIALSTFQKWDSIGKMFGIKNAAQQLESLNERIFELKLTGEGARGFQLAGIMPTNADNVMEQLRNRIKGMDDTAASYLLRQMGISPQMITLLRLSREEYEKLTSEVRQYQLTDEQRQSLAMMNVQLQIANQKMQYFKDQILMAILPDLVNFVRYIGQLAGGIAKVIKWVGQSNNGWAAFIRTLLKALGVILSITLASKGLPLIFKGITKAVKALGAALTALMAHPIILTLTAIVGAIALIADDINHYMNGGGSVIGVIAKALEEFQETGIFSDNIPMWIQVLARAADKLYEVYVERGRQKAQERTKNIVETAGASESVKDISARSFLGLPLISANFFDNLFNSKSVSDAFAKTFENYQKYLFGDPEYLLRRSAAPKSQINNKDIKVTQTNYIQTEQPAVDIYQELTFANSMFTR